MSGWPILPPCPCPVCTREGVHDPWCTVHLADYEHLEDPPCDCGLREGTYRVPELRPIDEHRAGEKHRKTDKN